MNGIRIFENPSFGQVRAVERNGDPWFVARDVCRVLELGNPTEAVRNLDDDEKADLRITEVSSNGVEQARNMNIVSESGLYSLVFRSRKPEARRFRKWVTAEVLPAIRRQGAYLTQSKIEDVFFKLDRLVSVLTAVATELKAGGERRAELDYRNQAVVEYLANMPEIDRLLGNGHNRKFVYDTLFGSGKINMSLPRFYDLVRNGAKRGNRKRNDHTGMTQAATAYEATVSIAITPPVTDARIIANPGGVFVTGISRSANCLANEER
jgi:prophage antirepressor-like protein